MSVKLSLELDTYYLFGLMPSYCHKETGKRFLFIHIPRTAGRFLHENFKLNGFEPEQLIWKHVDGIEIAHFHRELYQKHLNIKDIKHITIQDILIMNKHNLIKCFS